MYHFREGWEPDFSQPMPEALAKQFVMSLLQNQPKSPPPHFSPAFLPPPPPLPHSVQALHIGQYVLHMMNDLNYTLLDLTITKDPEGNLVFEVVNKEK